MLDPRSRGALLEALRPPPGYRVDAAIAATYSLDLRALLTAPLAFSLYDRLAAREGPGELDSLALLEAVRRHAERLVVFCQAGKIAVPKAHQRLVTYLEGSVVQARARHEGGVFHPKLWVVRLTSAEAPVRYRVLVNSRNLTFDRSWDTMLALDGELRDRKNAIAASKPLGELVAALPSLALQPSALSEGRRAMVAEIADELRRVEFERPEHVDEVVFWPMGLEGRPSQPFRERLGPRTLVVSPFLAGECLESLADQSDEVHLVSSAAELDKIRLETLRRMRSVHVLSDAAEGIEDSDEPPASTGLHAKLYVTDKGRGARVWTGSANASNAAFKANVELLVELVGNRKIGFERTLESLRPFLVDYIREDDSTLPSPETVAAERLMRRQCESLTYADWVATAERDGAGETFTVTLRARGAWSKEERCAISAWPISLPTARALPLEPGVAPVFEACSLFALTPFFAFEVRHPDAPEAEVFVVKAVLEGAPEDRPARLLQSMLDDPQKVLRFLKMLIAVDANEALAVLDGLDDSRAPRPGRPRDLMDEPLFESLTRALDRNPERLVQFEQTLRELRSGEGTRALMPPGLDDLWAPLWAAYQTMARERSGEKQ